MNARLVLGLLGLLLLIPPAAAHGLTLPAPLQKSVGQSPGPPAPVWAFEPPHPVLSQYNDPLDAPPQSGDNAYWIEFACTAQGLFSSPTSCPPEQVIDEDDLLGNIAYVFDPETGRRAFASLHGQSSMEPDRISRQGQTHTTYIEAAGTGQWQDNPYTPPGVVGPDASGQDVTAIFDELGNLHVASLYAQPDGSGWNYVIVHWNLDPSAAVVRYDEVAGTFQNVAPGTKIETMWLLNQPDLHQVVLLWRERAPEGESVQFGNLNLTGSWIRGARVSSLDITASWVPLPDAMIIGPCANTTNPVVFDEPDLEDSNRIYLGCEAASGYDLLPKVQPRDIVLHELDLRRLESRALARSPLRGGDPRLAVDENGRLAMITLDTIKVAPPSKNATQSPSPRPTPSNATGGNATHATRETPRNLVRAQISTSRDAGRTWSRVYDFGDQIHNRSLDVAAERVQALHYESGSNTVHFIYQEEKGPQDYREDDEDDPSPMWRKAYAVVDACGTVLWQKDLQIRDKGRVFQFARQFAPATEDPWGDTRDTMTKMGGRVFVGYNDYSIASLLEAVEHDERPDDAICGWVAPVEPPSAPVPNPVPDVVPNVIVVNTSLGVLSGSLAVVGIRQLALRKEAVGAGRGRR